MPHMNMEDVFQAYKAFSDTPVTEESFPAYVAAKTRLEEYLPFEVKLVR